MAPRRADSVEPRRNASMYESFAMERHRVLQPRKTLPWCAPHDLKERLSTVARQTFGKGGLRVADLLADLAIRGAVGLDRNPQPQILPETDHSRRSPDYLGDLAVEIMRIAIPMRPQKTNHRGL